MTFLPGSSIGILGGGQLGRMLAQEAQRLGYHTVTWTGNDEIGPAIAADEVIARPFDCEKTLKRFLSRVDVVTAEFENLPVDLLKRIEKQRHMAPSSKAIGIAQNREKEKLFLRDHDIPCAPFEVVSTTKQLESALKQLGGKGVLKTASFGYDGKGQTRVNKGDDLSEVWKVIGADRGVLEQWIPFEVEISVMIARGHDGQTTCWEPAENHHRHHMLDHSIVPARVPNSVLQQARKIASRVVSALDYQGVMGVEFFVTRDELMVNEIAPRPHNSGHFTQDACVTSQFEQQLRAVCGLPLGSTRLLSPVVMLNLLGDMWGGNPRQIDLEAIFDLPEARLHLYGKDDPGERRKMGHLNLLGEDPYRLEEQCLSLKETLLMEEVPLLDLAPSELVSNK